MEGVEVVPKTHPPHPLFHQNLTLNWKIDNIGFQISYFVPRIPYQGRGEPDRFSYTSSIKKEGATDAKHKLEQGEDQQYARVDGGR